MDTWWGNITLGVGANTVFGVVILVIGWSNGLAMRLRVARMLGASVTHPNVEIIVSNLMLDGTHTARGSEPTTVGYKSAATAQSEIESALRLKDLLTRTRLPLGGRSNFGSLNWTRIGVRIRPSLAPAQAWDGVEAANGFVIDQRGVANLNTRAIVIIGSPAYNRAAYDVIGPTIDIQGEYDNDGTISFPWSSTPEAHYLQDRSCVRWTRDVSDQSPGRRYPNGTRGFQPVDDQRMKGRDQQDVKRSFDHHIVQQIRCDAGAGAPDALGGLTVTIFAAVGDSGGAVNAFLEGDRNWRWLFRRLSDAAPWGARLRGNAYARWKPRWVHVWAVPERSGASSIPDIGAGLPVQPGRSEFITFDAPTAPAAIRERTMRKLAAYKSSGAVAP
jgi:hypothetical protein